MKERRRGVWETKIALAGGGEGVRSTERERAKRVKRSRVDLCVTRTPWRMKVNICGDLAAQGETTCGSHVKQCKHGVEGGRREEK